MNPEVLPTHLGPQGTTQGHLAAFSLVHLHINPQRQISLPTALHFHLRLKALEVRDPLTQPQSPLKLPSVGGQEQLLLGN